MELEYSELCDDEDKDIIYFYSKTELKPNYLSEVKYSILVSYYFSCGDDKEKCYIIWKFSKLHFIIKKRFEELKFKKLPISQKRNIILDKLINKNFLN